MEGDLGTGWLAGCGSFLLLLESSPCFLTLQVSGRFFSWVFLFRRSTLFRLEDASSVSKR